MRGGNREWRLESEGEEEGEGGGGGGGAEAAAAKPAAVAAKRKKLPPPVDLNDAAWWRKLVERRGDIGRKVAYLLATGNLVSSTGLDMQQVRAPAAPVSARA